MLLLQLQLLLLLPQLLDLLMEVLNLLLVYLGLLQHVLLESQSLLDQPVVLPLRLLPLLAPQGSLVLFTQLHLVALLYTAQLLLLHLATGTRTFLVRRTFSLSNCFRSLRAWLMSTRR